MNPTFKDYLLTTTRSSTCKEVEIIQSLWSGYGKISRYELKDSSMETVVIKHISPNQSVEHPRGWDTAYAHNRKIKSYAVEIHWYNYWNKLCDANCKIPDFLGSFSNGNEHWLILEDLNKEFPLRKYELDFNEIKVCLTWLANFHATFLSCAPDGLWSVGTYWHLSTRPDEWKKIEHQELKSKAHLIDNILNECKFQTIVHGDAKLANFCFSNDGKQVAAVDFQYVGGGCGMKDVAYFLGSCLSSDECATHETELLNYYFSTMEHALKSSPFTIHFKALEDEWRAMYPIACTDFTRFLLGWMPSHQKVNNYNRNMMHSVLAQL